MKGETIIRRSATRDDNDSLRSYHRQEEQDHPNNHTQRVADQGESRKSEFGRAIFSLLMPPASGVPSLVRILSSQFRSARGTAFPLSSLRTPFEKGSPQEDGPSLLAPSPQARSGHHRRGSPSRASRQQRVSLLILNHNGDFASCPIRTGLSVLGLQNAERRNPALTDLRHRRRGHMKDLVTPAHPQEILPCPPLFSLPIPSR